MSPASLNERVSCFLAKSLAVIFPSYVRDLRAAPFLPHAAEAAAGRPNCCLAKTHSQQNIYIFWFNNF